MQISTCWRDGAAVVVDLLPHAGQATLRARKRSRPKSGLRAALAELLPQRLADTILPITLSNGPIADIPDVALDQIEATLKSWTITPSGTEGFAKAEVTAGGIDTRELSSRTMEARSVPGLFAIGEAVDVTGWLGGYNFQWAWSSGVAAGEAC